MVQIKSNPLGEIKQKQYKGKSMDHTAKINELSQKIYREAFDFRRTLIEKNRFFIEHPFMERFKYYIEKVGGPKSPLQEVYAPKDTLYFRARLCDYEFAVQKHLQSIAAKSGKPYTSGFHGYDEENSFVPRPDIITEDGRTNPKYIRYLYVSEDEATAMIEVKPVLESFVSIAKITSKEPLSLLDIPRSLAGDSDAESIGFIMGINEFFSSPSLGELKDYLPAQYIAEYIKSLEKFDGIRFHSSLNKTGLNLTIFNYQKCLAVASKIYAVTQIHYAAECISPYGDHTKLEV